MLLGLRAMVSMQLLLLWLPTVAARGVWRAQWKRLSVSDLIKGGSIDCNKRGFEELLFPTLLLSFDTVTNNTTNTYPYPSHALKISNHHSMLLDFSPNEIISFGKKWACFPEKNEDAKSICSGATLDPSVTSRGNHINLTHPVMAVYRCTKRSTPITSPS